MKQAPIAIVLTCSDSRVVPEFILDQRLGDLFVVRVAGNTLDPMVLGSMEYAADHFGTSLILVLGHKRCGAVIAAVEAEGEPEGNVGSILANILPAVEQAKATCGAEAGPKLVDCAVEQNVRMVVKQIPEQSPLLAQLVKEGKLKIQGANYDLDDDSLTLDRGSAAKLTSDLRPGNRAFCLPWLTGGNDPSLRQSVCAGLPPKPNT